MELVGFRHSRVHRRRRAIDLERNAQAHAPSLGVSRDAFAAKTWSSFRPHVNSELPLIGKNAICPVCFWRRVAIIEIEFCWRSSTAEHAVLRPIAVIAFASA